MNGKDLWQRERDGARTEFTFQDFKQYLNSKSQPSNFRSVTRFEPSKIALKDKANSWFWSAIAFHAFSARGTSYEMNKRYRAGYSSGWQHRFGPSAPYQSAAAKMIKNAVDKLLHHFLHDQVCFYDKYVDTKQMKFSEEFVTYIRNYFDTNHNNVSLEIGEWVRHKANEAEQATKNRKRANDQMRRMKEDYIDSEKARLKRWRAEHPESNRQYLQKHRDKVRSLKGAGDLDAHVKETDQIRGTVSLH
jgi:hypothetical protein